MSARRARGGVYPLWVGLASIGLFTAFWFARSPSTADSDALTDAGLPDAAPPSAASDAAASTPQTRPAELIWQLTQAPARTGSEVGACLRAAGWDRITAYGGGEYPVSVTYSPLILPSLVTTTADGLELRTPIAARRHQAFALHTAIAACLPGTAIVDPDLGKLTDGDRWPSAERAAGMRVELAVRLTAVDGALHARGLGRLGLMDLVLEGPDTPVSRRRLQQAAALLLVQDDPDLVKMQFGDGEATLKPVTAPDLVRAHAITLPEGATAVAPPSEAPAPKTARRPGRTRRPKVRSPRIPPPKANPARPASKAPGSRWRPDYL